MGQLMPRVIDDYVRHVEGKPIIAIEAEAAIVDAPDRASFWFVKFYVEGYRLSLKTDEDTDEIIISIEPTDNAPSIVPRNSALVSLVGRTFGWLWRASNSQGYQDMAIIGFGGEGMGVTPQVAFLVEASAIHLHRLALV